ncbi:uncharacterized protein LOC110857569 [Folsomia candida]|uniref:uncharacterized protein LOC110857569 n=1 Tax=Folsomia candida TaxID=158441 RepID=UPI000B8FFE5F|nr:uncharacterized protein LOC110857569 [Folsomia candida]
MDTKASVELMESIFENELLLANIFSWLDLDTIKIVRLINTKWESVARKRFSEISLVFVRLKFDLSSANTRIKLDLNNKPFLTLWLDDGNDIITPLYDQLAPFKNFKLVFTIYAETVISDERMEEAYFCLNQLIRYLWRPNGSLTHSMGFFQNTSKDLLRSIIDGYNAFSHVEIEAGEYVWFINTSDLPKMICHTIRINPTTFPLTNVSNVFSHYVNTKKIIFEDASLINLDQVVRAIIGTGEQFGKLEEIDVTMKMNFNQLAALAGLRGLKRLKIRINDTIISESPMPALQECITKHAATLEFLHLEWMRCRVTSELSKLDSIEFQKLRKLYFGKNLLFEDVAEHEVDLFDLHVAIQNGTLRKNFPVLKMIEIMEPSETFYPVLNSSNISELGVKYGIQVMYNGALRG